MAKLETSGHKRFWPMRELQGINPDGSRRSTEGFRDMISGEFHTSEKGWDGEPPKLVPGERNLTDPGELYKKNYEKTFGHE